LKFFVWELTLELIKSSLDLKLRLFRPELNCKRMVNSAARISLPTFDPKELEKLIMELIKIDGESK